MIQNNAQIHELTHIEAQIHELTHIEAQPVILYTCIVVV